MIDRVHFENFKSLADVTIDLGRFTVLVGPNGCGKSSVLQGIDLLSQTGIPRGRDAGLGRFDVTFSGPTSPLRLAGDELMPMVFVVRRLDDGRPVTLEVRFDFEPTEPYSASVKVVLDDPGEHIETTLPAQIDLHRETARRLLNDERVRRFASCVYLRLDASRMVETSIPADESPRMRFDGAGLASVLAWMKGAAEDELAAITTALAQVVPGVRRIRTLRARVTDKEMERLDVEGQPIWRTVDKTSMGDRFEVVFANGFPVPADLLSEGTVLALGLLTKLHEPQRPRLVLLDDIDRGLHLSAQAEMVKRLRAILDREPDLQIVCTTHSPYLLDLFAPEEVRVMAIDAERRTHVRALSDHPDIEKWKIGTQTGELWATLGESWVLEAGGG